MCCEGSTVHIAAGRRGCQTKLGHGRVHNRRLWQHAGRDVTLILAKPAGGVPAVCGFKPDPMLMPPRADGPARLVPRRPAQGPRLLQALLVILVALLVFVAPLGARGRPARAPAPGRARQHAPPRGLLPRVRVMRAGRARAAAAPERLRAGQLRRQRRSAGLAARPTSGRMIRIGPYPTRPTSAGATLPV